MTNDRKRTIAYWVTTVLGPASFVMGGVMNLLRTAETTANLAHLGYPAYFGTLLGLGKLAGAVVIVAPGLRRLKEWAYAGFFIDLASASASHLFVGDAIGRAVAPLVFLALVLASWALRPESRRLPG
ncbi:MAG: hypothetical protein JWM10_107 [Myxococcaceae bacterium]|nr:hypothetical protein [Myxococcaceae bacterium]